MLAAKELIAAASDAVFSMHAELLKSRGDVVDLRNQVLELMETRAEVERLRAKASAAASRADDLSDQVSTMWDIIDRGKADALAQDVRIADLEALEGYGWRAPPVSLPKLDHGTGRTRPESSYREWSSGQGSESSQGL